jgi:diguanylate cyclase (GGDEF)-like protein
VTGSRRPERAFFRQLNQPIGVSPAPDGADPPGDEPAVNLPAGQVETAPLAAFKRFGLATARFEASYRSLADRYQRNLVDQPFNEAAASIMTRRLDALLELARVSCGLPLDAVFGAVVEVIERLVGFTTVVVNVYRPAWDDYEVVLVHGPDDARQALLHTVNSNEVWEKDILDPSHETFPGAFFIPSGNNRAWSNFSSFHVPEIAELPDPDSWRAEDALFVVLHASDGRSLGILSLDVPTSGRRPTSGDLEMLVAVANHAALALENSCVAAETERHRRTLTGLLGVSSRLASQTTPDGVLEQICANAVPDLGFEAVTAYLCVQDTFKVRTPRGLIDVTEPADFAALDALLEEQAVHGCALVKNSEVTLPAIASRRNGRGPLAWNDHRLLVPLRKRHGQLIGLLVFDDPVDRLLPDSQRLQALRLLADSAVATLETIDRQSLLEYLASHDPLTGVRNRRYLRRAISTLAAAPGGVSVLMCDLDHFKQVNDRFGHDVGDRVLQRFGTVLRDQSRADDIPVRIGGEEFCLILPKIDADAALIAAERLRRATVAALADLVPGLTVSIGIATSAPGWSDPRQLLAAADLALYAAKSAGRDQCCSAPPLLR